jgi:pimeloyl-ACP methyl ester carboxylesterase
MRRIMVAIFEERELMHEIAISRDGTPIAYEARGSGPPLVLVNGALGDRRSAGMLRPLLETSFTVVGFDRRGRGNSGDAPDYAPAREAEDLMAVGATLGTAPMVYGHSSGAVLALEAALAGMPVAALALYEPPYSLGGGPAAGVDLIGRMERLVANGERDAAVRAFFDEAIGLPEPVVDGLEAGPGWASFVALAHTLPYDLRLVGEGKIPIARVAGLRIRTLVLAGGSSPAWMRESAAALASAIPNSREVVLAGQAHSPASQLLAEQLIGFFEPAVVSER